MGDPGPDITRSLRDAADDAGHAPALIDLVYDQLRAIAQARMNAERPGHTLQATGLVNEACVRLLGSTGQRFDDRSHFFRAAAEAMRRVLIDHARGRAAEKRGGPGARRISIDVLDLAAESDPQAILDLDEAIECLRGEDAQAGEVVRLRFFAGLSVADTAAVLSVSERTVARDWAFARARLAELLTPDGTSASSP
ncbi:MAG: ECF-type sigma factor [Phycisphaerales bacterium]